jgi:hypothetical protein
MMRRVASLVLAGLAGCAGTVAGDPGIQGLAIHEVAPATIVPGTLLIVTGAGFVDETWGAATLRLQGMAGERAVDAAWPAAFIDPSTLSVPVDAGRFAALADGDLHGSALIEVVALDGQTYRSPPLAVDLAFRSQLAPAVAAIATGVIFIGDEIAVDGDGFLLGGDEGDTLAHVSGCFSGASPASGASVRSGDPTACRPSPAIELPLMPSTPRSRRHASFAFSPAIAGIQPGSFSGTVTVVNRPRDGAPVASAAMPVDFDVVTSQVFSFDPPAASLGQYVFVHGGGFVGGAGALTELELTGTLHKTGAAAIAVQMSLIPEVVSGRLARYVISPDDALGHALDVHRETGELSGSVTPIVSYGGDRVRGAPTTVALAIAPVKQVVYLAFEPSYVEGLRDFGLRAVDRQLRERILAACREPYRGVNIDFRTELPTDVALFETVELVGVDPNDQGLFGYDNSPGKDSGNLRLYDRIGGVNAQTQQDGYPGFGGVFLRSLLGFSLHPGDLAHSVTGADPVFDQIFDPFRPDRGGEPVASADLRADLAPLSDGTGCPAHDRAQQIRCAIYVLGNLIGGTIAHEVGHSLGLANPYQDGFHDPGDAPDRLMDAGEARPFLERAMLLGQGPAVFCDDEYAYLQQILPPREPGPAIARPRCR